MAPRKKISIPKRTRSASVAAPVDYSHMFPSYLAYLEDHPDRGYQPSLPSSLSALQDLRPSRTKFPGRTMARRKLGHIPVVILREGSGRLRALANDLEKLEKAGSYEDFMRQYEAQVKDANKNGKLW